MTGSSRTIANPLTLMAIFAGLSESVGAAVLPLVDAATRARLVWFVMLFPTALMLMFFATMWYNEKMLYGPRDLDTDAARLALLEVKPVSEPAETDEMQQKLETFLRAKDEKLQSFLRPDDGKSRAVANRNRNKMSRWLTEQGIEVPLPVFLESADHAEDRRRAVRDLIG